MDENMANLLLVLLGNVALISLVAIIGGFLQCRRERLLDHRERMKALEMGREWPGDESSAPIRTAYGIPLGRDREKGDEVRSPARKCFSTTLWIAFWGFLAAGQAGAGNTAVAIAIAAAVATVGVAGMVCGTILALQAPAASTASRPASKPLIDADAYDVVSCRG